MQQLVVCRQILCPQHHMSVASLFTPQRTMADLLSNLFMFNAVLTWVYGLLLAFMPDFVWSTVGVTVDAAGKHVSKVFNCQSAPPTTRQ